MLRFDFSMIEVGTLAEIERNFFDHVRLSVQSFAVRYRALADWSSALAAENPAMMIDRLRGVVQCEGLPPLYVIVDEYDNFTNELVVSNRDAEYDAVCGHDNVVGLLRGAGRGDGGPGAPLPRLALRPPGLAPRGRDRGRRGLR